MISRILTSIFVLALPVLGFAQSLDASNIKKHIKYLSADKMKGRGTGSKESEKTAKYIKKHFKKYKLQPLGTHGYYQPFEAKIRRVVVPDSIRQSKNVIGFLDNGAATTIVIGAHYDHLGMGTQGSSKHPSPHGHIHNGADDNASGTAGLLELARYYSTNNEKEPFNFLFMGFGAEELGLVGSRHFVKNPTLPLEKINFMVNMDMIGRYNPDEGGLMVIGVGSGDHLPALFKDLKHPNIKYYTTEDGSGGSDNAAFHAQQIPVLFFHTGGHPDYHMPTDDYEKVDVDALISILEIEIQAIKNASQFPKMRFKPLDKK